MRAQPSFHVALCVCVCVKGVEYICIKCTQRDIGNSYIKFMRDTNTSTNTFKPDTIIHTHTVCVPYYKAAPYNISHT